MYTYIQIYLIYIHIYIYMYMYVYAVIKLVDISAQIYLTDPVSSAYFGISI